MSYETRVYKVAKRPASFEEGRPEYVVPTVFNSFTEAICVAREKSKELDCHCEVVVLPVMKFVRVLNA